MLVEWRDRIARGEVSAREAVAAWARRLVQVDARTNCIAEHDPERALAAAGHLDDVFVRSGPVLPLHGVPFTVKDWIDVDGMRCTGGMTHHRDRRPARDATVVARLKNAGAVVVAKTVVQVESELGGVVRNPHDPDRSPGASSSGEAAAVGGGGSLLGVASDSGGSIRLPAAWCGAAGLKPTAGLVPTTGHFPRVGDRGDGRSQIGPIASSAADVAVVLPLLAGPDGIDPGLAPVAVGAADDVSLAGLRVARSAPDADWPAGSQVDAAVDAAVRAVTDRGATRVDDVDLRLGLALDITQRYWSRVRLTGAECDQQLRDWDHFRWSLTRACEGVDVIIAPTTVDVAPLHRPMAGEDYVFTLPASLTGWPAVNAPLHHDGALPIGVQVIARPWRDDVALAVAAVVETPSCADDLDE